MWPPSLTTALSSRLLGFDAIRWGLGLLQSEAPWGREEPTALRTRSEPSPVAELGVGPRFGVTGNLPFPLFWGLARQRHKLASWGQRHGPQ